MQEFKVNEYITLFTKNLSKSLVRLDAHVGPLAIKSFFFTGQLDCHPLELQTSHLRNKEPVLLAGKERVVADFNDCRTESGLLAKLGKKESKGPESDPAKGHEKSGQDPAWPCIPKTRNRHCQEHEPDRIPKQRQRCGPSNPALG